MIRTTEELRLLNCIRLYVKAKHILPGITTFPVQTAQYTRHLFTKYPEGLDLIIEVSLSSKRISLIISAEGPDDHISKIQNSKDNKKLLLSRQYGNMMDKDIPQMEISYEILSSFLEIITANIDVKTAWQNIYKRNKEANKHPWVLIRK